MPDNKIKIAKCSHISCIFHLFNSINYCMICSAFFFTNCSPNESIIKTIKPNNFGENIEAPSCLLSLSEEEKNNSSNKFYNKKDYLKKRSSIIKNIKKICSYFSLSLKTYFLSVEYFDKICAKMSSFNPDFLFQISLFCIILATKFNEQASKTIQVQTELRNNISRNYTADEIYVLNLLNYELNIYTSYDILLDILNMGFVFHGEELNYKKMNYLYYNLEKILYIFSEMNSYIEMSPKKLAICMIGFARELLDLNPFSDSIKKIFLINQNNEKDYITGLHIIKKRIKIERKINTKYNEENSKFCEQSNNREDNKTVAIFCNKYIN